MGGVISYTNGVKHRLLGVSEDTLRVYTAVSRQTAHEMARGAREAVRADVGVSVTGLARAGRRWDRAAHRACLYRDRHGGLLLFAGAASDR